MRNNVKSKECEPCYVQPNWIDQNFLAFQKTPACIDVVVLDDISILMKQFA